MSNLMHYEKALNALKLNKKEKVNNDLNIEGCDSRLIPAWVKGKDFTMYFLPYLKLKVDSREQDDWITRMCEYFKISVELAKKDRKKNTENLKEGDITFIVQFGDKVYDYTNIVAYERKGSASEFCNNVMSDRDRLEREFERQLQKGYRKFVLVLEFGDKLLDLIDYEFTYYNKSGQLEKKSCGQTVYATVCSWVQPNKYAFDLIQVDTQTDNKFDKARARGKLFWLMLYDMYYFFRQEIRLEAQKLEIKGEQQL